MCANVKVWNLIMRHPSQNTCMYCKKSGEIVDTDVYFMSCKYSISCGTRKISKIVCSIICSKNVIDNEKHVILC